VHTTVCTPQTVALQNIFDQSSMTPAKIKHHVGSMKNRNSKDAPTVPLQGRLKSMQFSDSSTTLRHESMHLHK